VILRSVDGSPRTVNAAAIVCARLLRGAVSPEHEERMATIADAARRSRVPPWTVSLVVIRPRIVSAALLRRSGEALRACCGRHNRRSHWDRRGWVRPSEGEAAPPRFCQGIGRPAGYRTTVDERGRPDWESYWAAVRERLALPQKSATNLACEGLVLGVFLEGRELGSPHSQAAVSSHDTARSRSNVPAPFALPEHRRGGVGRRRDSGASPRAGRPWAAAAPGAARARRFASCGVGPPGTTTEGR
jgi:hypothetical protein